MWDENFKFLVNYYNYDNGIDLPAEPDGIRFPYRAICANIAWCMVNKERFWEYYNKSEYWRIKLMTAARQFGVKNYEHGLLGNDDSLKNTVNTLYGSLTSNIGKKIYLKPSELDYTLDFSTIFVIAHEAKEGIC